MKTAGLVPAFLQFSRVVGPVEKGLPLFAMATEVVQPTVLFDLPDVPANGFPASDLLIVVSRNAPA